MGSNWNIVITVLGVIIASLQLRLSWQINKLELTKEKGYFILRKTNMVNRGDEQYRSLNGKFDFRLPLYFDLKGNGDVFLVREQILINGVIVENLELLETFFSVRDTESIDDYFGIELPMKESYREYRRLNVEIILRLKNLMGNIYTENISIEFERENGDWENICQGWTLRRRNTSFKF